MMQKKRTAAESFNTRSHVWTILRYESHKELSDKYGFKIIEDASHAVGGNIKILKLVVVNTVI